MYIYKLWLLKQLSAYLDCDIYQVIKLLLKPNVIKVPDFNKQGKIINGYGGSNFFTEDNIRYYIKMEHCDTLNHQYCYTNIEIRNGKIDQITFMYTHAKSKYLSTIEVWSSNIKTLIYSINTTNINYLTFEDSFKQFPFNHVDLNKDGIYHVFGDIVFISEIG